MEELNNEKYSELENEYIMTNKLAKEVSYRISKKNSIIGYIIAIINIGFYLLGYMILEEKYYGILAIGIGCLIVAILYPILNSKRIMESYQIGDNGKIEKTNIKFEENIKVNRGNNHSEYEYSQIYSKIETKNCIILRLKMDKKASVKIVMIIIKDGFIKRKFR